MTLGSHQRTIGASQTHITPKWIIDALGPFDLDPCAATVRPWDCAARNIVEAQDGLTQAWAGRVWLNPPFARYGVAAWIRRLADHGDGIALLHARTETEWFGAAWDRADAILFMGRRLVFRKPDGTPQTTKKGLVANSGAPPVLVAFGVENTRRLAVSGIQGQLVTAWGRVGAVSADLSEAAE